MTWFTQGPWDQNELLVLHKPLVPLTLSLICTVSTCYSTEGPRSAVWYFDKIILKYFTYKNEKKTGKLDFDKGPYQKYQKLNIKIVVVSTVCCLQVTSDSRLGFWQYGIHYLAEWHLLGISALLATEDNNINKYKGYKNQSMKMTKAKQTLTHSFNDNRIREKAKAQTADLQAVHWTSVYICCSGGVEWVQRSSSISNLPFVFWPPVLYIICL